jgi:hypothetical protein
METLPEGVMMNIAEYYTNISTGIGNKSPLDYTLRINPTDWQELQDGLRRAQAGLDRSERPLVVPPGATERISGPEPFGAVGTLHGLWVSLDHTVERNGFEVVPR